MKVKLLRTIGTELARELGAGGAKVPPVEELQENAEVDVPGDVAESLVARALAEIVGKHEAVKHEAPKPKPGDK